MTQPPTYGSHNSYPLSQMRSELVWEGKYDEYGQRREVDIAGCAMPMQQIEGIDEPRRKKDIETQIVIDPERDHYLLLRVGWEGDKRINYPVFHFDIKDGKIWVQENNTDVELDKDLEEMGISKKEIVRGFHHPLMREYSDYATV